MQNWTVSVFKNNSRKHIRYWCNIDGMLNLVSALFCGISVLNFPKLVFLDAQSWTSSLPKLLCWVFAMVVRKVFKMYKRGKKCRREVGKAHKKDSYWKKFGSYLGWLKFSISLLTWPILFLLEKEHCSFLPNVMHHFQNTSLLLLTTSH